MTDAKLAQKVYPTRPRDCEFIDKTYAKLHKQKCIEYAKAPILFGFLVFVVWRTVNRERKGRMVVNI
jgi:hypothetical protein